MNVFLQRVIMDWLKFAESLEVMIAISYWIQECISWYMAAQCQLLYCQLFDSYPKNEDSKLAKQYQNLTWCEGMVWRGRWQTGDRVVGHGLWHACIWQLLRLKSWYTHWPPVRTMLAFMVLLQPQDFSTT